MVNVKWPFKGNGVGNFRAFFECFGTIANNFLHFSKLTTGQKFCFKRTNNSREFGFCRLMMIILSFRDGLIVFAVIICFLEIWVYTT